MRLKNCKRCGKLFTFQGYYVCQACQERDTIDFAKIWEYVQSHPRVSALELSRETGVDASVVLRFQREGRLTAVEKKEETE
ncbi:MAG TPA: hypothetical protein DD734_03890 [Firmicutes bacterium]|nr:hypothetical protein [Bacillota bacterium]HBR33750.1 hypothetical protein [Bacillota bacterium]